MGDGITLLIGGGAAGALITAVTQVLTARMRQPRKVEPTPLPVAHVPACVAADRCEAMMAKNEKDHEAIFLRLSAVEQRSASHGATLDAINQSLKRIESKVDKLNEGAGRR